MEILCESKIFAKPTTVIIKDVKAAKVTLISGAYFSMKAISNGMGKF